MITVDHAFKIAERSLSDSAEIDVNEHKNRNHEANKNVKEICQV
jgi:hypothetical protein